MEPQPGSPASPPSPGTSSSSPNSAEVTRTPSEEMPATDEPLEEDATEVEQEEPGRKSTSSSSSSSSSSSASSAGSLRHVDVFELGDTLLVPAPEEEQSVTSPEQSGEGKPDGGAAVEDQQAAPHVESAGAKPDDAATPEDEQAAATVHVVEVKPDDRTLPEDQQAKSVCEQAAAPAVHSAEVKPDDWATWPEPPPAAVVDYSFSSDGSAGPAAAPTLPTTEAPQIQTMPKIEGAAGKSEFDPQRIPASVFRTSVSQAEWSMTSNESLFSIQGASDVGVPYAGSRSHFDFFYDEAMAAASGGGAEQADSSKLPSVAEGTEPAEFKEFAVPGSASSLASAGSADNAKKAAVFEHHESGSGGSSSNFSFAFPILAPTSPKKKDLVSSALYQPLEKEWDQPLPVPPPMEPPASAFVEMTTEAERRGSTGCCCCGCCWFDCSWATCCGWWRCCSCSCCCSCPSFCRCRWCLCS